MSRYSNDFRKQVAKQFESGVNISTICEEYGIGEDTAYRWRKQLQQGTLFDEVHVGGRPVVYDLEGLKQFVTDYPDKLLREIKVEFFESSGNTASTSGIDVALKKMNFKFKKRSNFSKNEMS